MALPRRKLRFGKLATNARDGPRSLTENAPTDKIQFGAVEVGLVNLIVWLVLKLDKLSLGDGWDNRLGSVAVVVAIP